MATPDQTAERLAAAFVEMLAEYLTPEQWAEMRRRNATPAYAESCASHDFTDSNIAMGDAFTVVTGREVDVNDEAQTALWGAAWDIAKRDHLTAA